MDEHLKKANHKETHCLENCDKLCIKKKKKNNIS